MSFKRAREELAAWRQRLRLIECLGPGIESPWLCDSSASGFDFVALRTVEDFIAESEALENCLDQYADQLHTGLILVFCHPQGARRVASSDRMHDEREPRVQLVGVLIETVLQRLAFGDEVLHRTQRHEVEARCRAVAKPGLSIPDRGIR